MASGNGNGLPPSDVQRIAAALQRVGADSARPCVRCGAADWGIVGFSRKTMVPLRPDEDPPLTDDLPGIGVVVTACGRCGAIVEHVANMLGL